MKRGVTLIELLISVAIISILASMTLPATRISVIRTREYELKRNLMVIREALDEFKREFEEAGEKKQGDEKVAYGDKTDNKEKKQEDKFIEIRDKMESGYPPTLETLVEYKYLRRVPSDPFSQEKSEGENSNWGIISYTENGGDVYDVYSKSSQTSLEGSRYSEW
ncbi:type II secretion system pseudopilin PulG [Propionigenium maris DSM 9537]|uniref:Type II secretion system pseudopilin PulG n=1 Tax=Propionigenium maris DSM 9537 TaxID=1123000 RepID=A0A9W6LP25_9FUSO|nr:type II secretion system protein [Propionigenium maris]GLI57544.1 type II secretion system pseudopilin PulG [Propionigenium maris DSM 9537]